MQSNIFVTKRAGLLADCNAASASYLFQPDKFYDISYDTGDKSLQCGRKTDAFQVWFMLKTRGESYFAAAMENALAQVDIIPYAIGSLQLAYFSPRPIILPSLSGKERVLNWWWTPIRSPMCASTIFLRQ